MMQRRSLIFHDRTVTYLMENCLSSDKHFLKEKQQQ